jgi:BirA family biotin operon repressor/biotin-[acetyl-CoA-carboxylase] ligase
MTSVAVAKTINKLFPLKAEIKWTNNVLVNHKKVCGILAEAQTKGETLDYVILGIGINANFDLNALPVYLRDFSTTLKEELKKEIERESLLRTLLEETEYYYDMFTRGKFDIILKEWRSLTSFLGFYIKIVSDRERIEGWAINIDKDGALMVKLKDQTIRKVTSGDVTTIKKIKIGS